ncbi:hypothetical protein [Schlesneria paludicola]|uniref:hypothetical protein n=1 Tax=Schlesneria paludicola TaxID=360056 RepID=UPI00031E0E3B|nr:hypothetical protein [Schlesneria paludicola]
MALAIAALAQVGRIGAEDTRLPRLSGPEVGTEVTTFYVRAVTGPHSGKSVCYVCRNGNRPVVMVLLRELGPDVARLLKQLNATVDRHRADGLRCFVVLLGDANQKDFARLQTLAFDEKLEIPLTLAAETLAGSALKSISEEAAVTVVLYDHLKITRQFSFRTAECDSPACQQIVRAADELARDAAF